MHPKDIKLGLELTQANAVQWFQSMEILLRSVECWDAVTTGAGDDQKLNDIRLAISYNVGDDLIHIIDPFKPP